jgi:PRTRC genetic system ThiF family protein
MSYRIVTNPNVSAGNRQDAEAVIVIVGCGGTGGFLAEAVCRLLIGRQAQLFLIDPDRVEPHNCLRQAFAEEEVGQFKAEVLARRLSRMYHRTIGYDVRPYDCQTHGGIWQATRADLPLLIGCVDNAAARAAIARSLFDSRDGGAPGYGATPSRPAPWWLDLGNGEQEGQAFLGNAAYPRSLRGAFQLAAGTVSVLPAPSLQAPALLAAPPAPQQQPAADCAEAVDNGAQSPVINQAMAMLGAVFVQQLLTGTCSWLQAAINLTDGVLHTLPADPRLVARISGLHTNTLVDRHDGQARYQEAGDSPRDATLAAVFGQEAVRTAQAALVHRTLEREALIQAMAQAPLDEQPGEDLLAALATAQRGAAQPEVN